MKMMKPFIVNTMVVLLFLVGCNNTVDPIGKVEVSREIMVDRNDGNEPIRWFTAPLNYEDVAAEDKDAAEEIEEIWGIFDSLDWEKEQASTNRPADFRVEIRDHREEEVVSTVYFLWITDDNKNIKLVNKDESVQAQLNETDSERLYKILFNRDLADRAESEEENSDENIASVIFTEKTVPSDFEEAGFKREETPYSTYLVKQVTGQEEFNELWDYFRFENVAPEIDFKENNVVFLSLTESGSCPHELDGEDVRVAPDKETLEIQITRPKDMCSDDRTARTFVIGVSKEVNSIKNVEISESNIQTIVPMN